MKDLIRIMFKGMETGAARAGSDMRGHMTMLYLLARHFSGGKVVELGVGSGWSTVSLLAGCIERGGVLDSYDIDPNAELAVQRNLHSRLGGGPWLPRWRFHLKDSTKAAADFEDGSVSLMFLDTSHTLEDVRRELPAWLPKMQPEGVMCGHDYFLHEDPRWKWSGVKTAVDEFAAGHKSRFHLQVLPHDRGLFIMWPRSFWDQKLVLEKTS